MRPSRVAVCGCLLLVCVPLVSLDAQESPSRSVFQLVVMAREFQGLSGANYHSVTSGTAFFISSDGTALTNSHTVYEVRTNRITYQLLAIVGQEFYGARLVCANKLPQDPTKSQPHGVRLSRDVAEIKLTSPPFFDPLTYNGVSFARAHTGPLPAFPVLTFGADPAVGDPVRVLGFGRLINSPFPYEWSAQGTVRDLKTAPDGTPLFDIGFTREAEPGHSGSPVLNAQDQVIGIYTWQSISDHARGTAISRSALDPACP